MESPIRRLPEALLAAVLSALELREHCAFRHCGRRFDTVARQPSASPHLLRLLAVPSPSPPPPRPSSSQPEVKTKRARRTECVAADRHRTVRRRSRNGKRNARPPNAHDRLGTVALESSRRRRSGPFSVCVRTESTPRCKISTAACGWNAPHRLIRARTPTPVPTPKPSIRSRDGRRNCDT